MSTPVLAVWHAEPATKTITMVIPDGCRDLIMRVAPGKKPHWFVSSLEDHTYRVSLAADVFMQGFRLHPATRIDDARLLASVQHQYLDLEDLRCRLTRFTHRSHAAAAALECLRTDIGSVARAARVLGVNQRSLQRVLTRETGRPPAYWLSLARVRKAARAILEQGPLAEISILHGYADQAHMSRNIKHWLNISPSKLRHSAEHCDQLNAAGYC